MLARYYRRSDAAALDRILGFNRAGDVRLDRDRIIVTGPTGHPDGVLVWRPGGLIHEFHCGEGALRYARAVALINYAIADGTARPFDLYDAVFFVEESNTAMAGFLGKLGAVRLGPGQALYRLPVKGEGL